MKQQNQCRLWRSFSLQFQCQTKNATSHIGEASSWRQFFYLLSMCKKKQPAPVG